MSECSQATHASQQKSEPAAFHVGQLVIYRPEHSTPAERGAIFVIVEWNGDRGFVSPAEWAGGIKPRELVRMDMIRDAARAVAAAFATHIRANLTAEQLAEVVRLNATPEYSGLCATHNYFDANDCLDFAWQEVFGRDMDLQSDADMAIANRAWDLAKAAGFAASKTEAE